MFNVLNEMNWLAILITTVVFSILGGIWFTLFFGKSYAYSLGQNYDPKERPKPLFIVGPFICGLVTIMSISILVYTLNISSLKEAIILGLVIGLGIMSSTSVNTAINPNIPRPLLYGLISGGYFTLSSILGSIILYAMK
jgi:hypothetical protein